MRNYKQELDGFSVGEVVALTNEQDTRWKILKLWVREWLGRPLHLANLACANPGPKPRHNRRVGTLKDAVSTGWLMKLSTKEQTPMKTLSKCQFCETKLNELGFEQEGEKHYHTLVRCFAVVRVQLQTERDLVEGLEELVGLLQVAEHAQDPAEIETVQKHVAKLYEACKAAGGGPRCKLCGAPRTPAQVFCGAGCSVRWEVENAHEVGK